jgi:branched-chain amino acid transport system permease protein
MSRLAGSPKAAVERSFAAAVVILLAIWPVVFSGNSYWVSYILTQTFVLGIAAASLTFLAAYGGMVSLAQVALYGICGFILGNLVVTGEAKGLHLGWDPWLAVVAAIAITTGIGLVFGAVASRSAGIYFLIITLTFGVIASSFFTSVTDFGGFSGVAGIDSYTPGLVGNPNTEPARIYYIGFVLSILIYVLIRYLVRTPFGIALQGVRDEPIRLRSLGYNVPLIRTLAFGLAGFMASLAGILYGWSIGAVAPATMGLEQTVNLLIIAVIGGLARIEGAWIGAFVFTYLNNELFRNDTVPVLGGSFPTIIGFIFLAIVVVSPNGLLGMWDMIAGRVFGAPPGAPRQPLRDLVVQASARFRMKGGGMARTQREE